MLASVHIQGHPPFADLAIPRLGGINLITGYNNAGKTALLRAVRLLAGSFTEEAKGAVSLVTEIEGRRVVLEGRLAASSNAGTPTHRGTAAPEHRPPPRVACVFPDGDDGPENARLLARLGRCDREALHEVLRTFRPELRSVACRGVAMVCDVGLPDPMPMGLMGAGMVQAARLLLAVMAAPGGLVLADEIGNGLHHKQLVPVWRSLCARAARNRVQVFATTHSEECIRAALLAQRATLTAAPGILQPPLLVHRIDDCAQSPWSRREGHICTTYAPDSLGRALDHASGSGLFIELR